MRSQEVAAKALRAIAFVVIILGLAFLIVRFTP